MHIKTRVLLVLHLTTARECYKQPLIWFSCIADM